MTNNHYKAGTNHLCDMICSIHIRSQISWIFLTHHSVGSRLISPRPSWAMSSCEKSGNSTWMPPIELRVQCIECVTTAFTSCKSKSKNKSKSKFQFNQRSINRLSCQQFGIRYILHRTRSLRASCFML